ncbi:MAG TPA: radical SAM protein [Humidesulfovibrio sp.]|uniref:radical SAM protein n=1 Tax=Humidesulfovibrio sp. TaxID=2910988 RepID=UPI002B7B4B11|nr:radical SAM protein [Humidesulfovibrio sp.]HWR04542.1 radical SAM protein [Humidesulfovibrio sp.]
MIHHVRQIPQGGRAAIYGTGGRADKLMAQLREHRPDITPVAFLSGNPQTATHNGLPLLPGTRAAEAGHDFVIIAAYGYDEIAPVLRRHGGGKPHYVFLDMEAANAPKPPRPVPDPALNRDVLLRCGSPEEFRASLRRLPEKLHFTLSSDCNCACIFCPCSHKPRGGQMLDPELARDVLAQMAALGMRGADFSPIMGEGMLHPQFYELLAAARAAGMTDVRVTTNGTLLPAEPERARLLLDLADGVSVSSPGLMPEAYRKVFRSGRFDAVMAGLEALGQAKLAGGKGRVNICLRTYRPFEETFEDTGFLRLAPLFKAGGLFFDPADGSIEFDTWAGAVDAEVFSSAMRVAEGGAAKGDPPCGMLLAPAATVLPDGSLRLCPCRYQDDPHDELVLGNLKDEPLDALLYGPAHFELVRRWCAGDIPPVCRSCALYSPPDPAWLEPRA